MDLEESSKSVADVGEGKFVVGGEELLCQFWN
jgi:hypothetical protein